MGVMDQSVDGGHGHHVVREDDIPAAERLFVGDQQAARLVAMSDELKQHRGLGFAAFNVANAVADQQTVGM